MSRDGGGCGAAMGHEGGWIFPPECGVGGRDPRSAQPHLLFRRAGQWGSLNCATAHDDATPHPPPTKPTTESHHHETPHTNTITTPCTSHLTTHTTHHASHTTSRTTLHTPPHTTNHIALLNRPHHTTHSQPTRSYHRLIRHPLPPSNTADQSDLCSPQRGGLRRPLHRIP